MGFRTIVAVLGAVVLGMADAWAGSFFKTSGQQILDTNGAAFLMKGQGLNGWLTPEAYQLRLNAVHKRHIGSSSDIQIRIHDLLKNENDEAAFWALYRTNYVTMADLGIFKAQGFNTVRLPFNYRLVQPWGSTNTWDDAGFQMLSNIIGWCKSVNLAVILDMHCAPGGQSGDASADPEHTDWVLDASITNWVEKGIGCLWETNAHYTTMTGRTPEWNQQRTVNIWREIAKRFKNETLIIGYELVNEPYLPTGVHWPVLRGLLTNITAAIRAEDTNHIIFAAGNYFSGTFEGLTPMWDSNMVLVFHQFWSTATTANISTFLGDRTSNNVPILMGESGENSNPWFYQFRSVLESNDVGWGWWGWKKVDSVASAYSVLVTTNYQYVINNFRDTPVDANIVMRGLMEMATNLQTSLCRYEPGYFLSLRDPQFGVLSKPYAYLAAPGFIPATDYDVGNNGTEYMDTRYMQEDGASGAAWNSGWAYRNDGVDIYATTSGLGNNYKVGSIAAGEWIRYTLVVPVASCFDVVARVSSPSAAGRLLLKLNGTNLTSTLMVPATGDWESWTNLYGGNVYINAGTNSLEMSAVDGGYDLASITFYPTNPLLLNDGYYNHPALNPATEQVPGTNGFGSFLQVNYAITTTTFFVLAPFPTVAPRYNETGQVAIKISFYNPESNEWSHLYTRMSNVAQAVFATNAPFHGLPTSGSVTVNVFRFDWSQPRGLTGQPLTNAITVSYAPYFQSFLNGVETERLYFAGQNPGFTNAYPESPQYFATNSLDTDYVYTNQFMAPGPDTDGDDMPDAWEWACFGNMTNTAAGDNDGDGVGNYEEYIADTQPTNKSSYLRQNISDPGATTISLTVSPSSTARWYCAYVASNLLGLAPWFDTGVNSFGNGGTLILTVTNAWPVGLYNVRVNRP